MMALAERNLPKIILRIDVSMREKLCLVKESFLAQPQERIEICLRGRIYHQDSAMKKSAFYFCVTEIGRGRTGLSSHLSSTPLIFCPAINMIA
jgi:hypothetical protein